MTTGKTIALTRWTFVGKVMSLLFNMLSRLVIVFLPRSKHLLISRLQSPSAVIFGAPKHKVTVSPSICHEMMEPDAIILVFWMLSFKPTFSLTSFTFIKRFFSSSSLSAIRVVSSAYLRLLIFLLAILIPACASSSLWWSLHSSFSMMYSAQKLNKQGDNIQPWHIPFPIWNQSVVPCPVLTLASWPPYLHTLTCFLTLISQEAGRVIWYSHLSKNFPQLVVIHTVKGFSIVNEADVFLEFPCFFYGPTDGGNLMSSSNCCLITLQKF